jgi:hypothetical protein
MAGSMRFSVARCGVKTLSLFLFPAISVSIESEWQIAEKIKSTHFFSISDYVKDPTPIIEICGQLLHSETMYELWTRGRVDAVFGAGIPSPNFDGEGWFIDQTFIACRLEREHYWSAYIFICESCEFDDQDEFDRPTKLRFYRNKRLTEVYREITKDFWHVLLREPNLIYPYQSYYNYFDGLCGASYHVSFCREDKFYAEVVPGSEY